MLQSLTRHYRSIKNHDLNVIPAEAGIPYYQAKRCNSKRYEQTLYNYYKVLHYSCRTNCFTSTTPYPPQAEVAPRFGGDGGGT